MAGKVGRRDVEKRALRASEKKQAENMADPTTRLTRW
jgi:hypothetical protein